MRTRAKPMMLAGLLTSSLLGGCATNIAATADSSCKSFRPLSMSKKDTDDTKRQIIGHNKAYDAICPAKASHG